MAKDEPITFRCPDELHKRLERLAKKADMPKARLVYNIVDECSKTLEATEKVGVFQFALLLRNMGENLTEWAKNIKSKKVELP